MTLPIDGHELRVAARDFPIGPSGRENGSGGPMVRAAGLKLAGDILAREGKIEAINAYREALEASGPRSGWILAALAAAYEQFGQPEVARPLFEAAFAQLAAEGMGSDSARALANARRLGSLV